MLYECETWSLTLQEKHRLWVFENSVLKRIFGSMRMEVAEGWRRLHNEELHNLYASANITWVIKSRKKRWAKFWSKNLKGRDHMKDLSIYGKIIIEMNLGK
jgi:hypothetical protein